MIGKVEIPNRFAVLLMSLGALSYDEEGGYSDNLINYFSLRAKDGFGLIITGAATILKAVWEACEAANSI